MGWGAPGWARRYARRPRRFAPVITTGSPSDHMASGPSKPNCTVIGSPSRRRPDGTAHRVSGHPFRRSAVEPQSSRFRILGSDIDLKGVAVVVHGVAVGSLSRTTRHRAVRELFR